MNNPLKKIIPSIIGVAGSWKPICHGCDASIFATVQPDTTKKRIVKDILKKRKKEKGVILKRFLNVIFIIYMLK
jgi:hypothetical protein